MTKFDRPPRFQPWRAPTQSKKPFERVRTETAPDRGNLANDWRWRKLSVSFRKKNPFCRFCDQAGFDTQPCDVVDHIIPRAWRPDLIYEWSNLISLCHHHHSKVKQGMEIYAKKIGDPNELLPMWCKMPETRPAKFAIGFACVQAATAGVR